MTKGYIEFFFCNAKYRRLWAASVISLLGEWFNTIALFLLFLEYSRFRIFAWDSFFCPYDFIRHISTDK